MLHRNVIESRGFRQLDAVEQEAVGGGSWVANDTINGTAIPTLIILTDSNDNFGTCMLPNFEGGFDWFPSDSGAWVDTNGDGEGDTIVVTADAAAVERWSAFAESATYWTQHYLGITTAIASAEYAFGERIAGFLGLSLGAVAGGSYAGTAALAEMTEDELRDFWFEYARGVEENPATHPLENQGNNPGGTIYWP